MNLFQKQQKTSGYASIPNAIADDEETATTRTMDRRVSRWRTTDRRWSKGRMLVDGVVATGMMLLLVMGGAVWMRQDGGSSYDHSSGSRETADGGRTITAEGLVLPPPGDDPCLPAGGAFGGVSTTSNMQRNPFETCYQYGKVEKYCWTKSYRDFDGGPHSGYGSGGGFSPCVPDPPGGQWRTVDPRFVNTPGVDPNINPKRCGPPCQGQHVHDVNSFW